jgi:hypothetical protein
MFDGRGGQRVRLRASQSQTMNARAPRRRAYWSRARTDPLITPSFKFPIRRTESYPANSGMPPRAITLQVHLRLDPFTVSLAGRAGVPRYDLDRTSDSVAAGDRGEGASAIEHLDRAGTQGRDFASIAEAVPDLRRILRLYAPLQSCNRSPRWDIPLPNSVINVLSRCGFKTFAPAPSVSQETMMSCRTARPSAASLPREALRVADFQGPHAGKFESRARGVLPHIIWLPNASLRMLPSVASDLFRAWPRSCRHRRQKSASGDAWRCD